MSRNSASARPRDAPRRELPAHPVRSPTPANLPVPVPGVLAADTDDRIFRVDGGPKLKQVSVHDALGELPVAPGVPAASAHSKPLRAGRDPVKASGCLTCPGRPANVRTLRHYDGYFDHIIEVRRRKRWLGINVTDSHA